MDEELTLESICRDWHGLRRLALRHGKGTEFKRLIELARGGAPIASNMAELLGLAPGDSDSHETPGSSREGPVELPLIVGHVADGVYICPAAICPRQVHRNPGDPLPYCGIHGRNMLFQ